MFISISVIWYNWIYKVESNFYNISMFLKLFIIYVLVSYYQGTWCKNIWMDIEMSLQMMKALGVCWNSYKYLLLEQTCTDRAKKSQQDLLFYLFWDFLHCICLAMALPRETRYAGYLFHFVWLRLVGWFQCLYLARMVGH